VISDCISLITAFLLYVSILTAFYRERSARHLFAFVKSFLWFSVFITITVFLEVLKNGYGIWPNPLGFISNGVFLLGFVYFFLGIRNSATYLKSYHEEMEKLAETQEVMKRHDNEIKEAQKRQNTKVCPNCGETVNKIAKVCRYCGYRFKGKKKPT